MSRYQADELWNHIYGASIARQVFDMIGRGEGPPPPVTMTRFIFEAIAVADMATDELRELNQAELDTILK